MTMSVDGWVERCLPPSVEPPARSQKVKTQHLRKFLQRELSGREARGFLLKPQKPEPALTPGRKCLPPGTRPLPHQPAGRSATLQVSRSPAPCPNLARSQASSSGPPPTWAEREGSLQQAPGASPHSPPGAAPPPGCGLFAAAPGWESSLVPRSAQHRAEHLLAVAMFSV